MLIDYSLAATRDTWTKGLYVWPAALQGEDGPGPTYLWWDVSYPLKGVILDEITQKVLRQHNRIIEGAGICL